MKIKYITDISNSIYIQEDVIHQLYSEETVDINGTLLNKQIIIYTNATTKKNFLHIILLFIKKLIFNVFNVVVMNFPSKWFNKSDPYAICAKYTVKDDTINIRYVSAKVLDMPINIQVPKLIINGEEVDVRVYTDINAIKYDFLEYCFDIISFWIYSIFLITMIFVFSGKFFELYMLFFLLSVCITIPLIWKIHREIKTMKKIVAYLKNEDKDKSIRGRFSD